MNATFRNFYEKIKRLAGRYVQPRKRKNEIINNEVKGDLRENNTQHQLQTLINALAEHERNKLCWILDTDHFNLN